MAWMYNCENMADAQDRTRARGMSEEDRGMGVGKMQPGPGSCGQWGSGSALTSGGRVGCKRAAVSVVGTQTECGHI